ncbi:hypothetical protein HMPREF0201_01011 [Cedecea davisae DSM 4568]|uniref:Uncharacterized protein n=1 Tax=Cedecea davisae DSM 4568 TaxID=566551 RepID=S3JDZ2_9ENTR|nr:hypothetical protein HMPREF0201_01011 [Cedecea davisae DSM 4568]
MRIPVADNKVRLIEFKLSWDLSTIFELMAGSISSRPGRISIPQHEMEKEL